MSFRCYISPVADQGKPQKWQRRRPLPRRQGGADPAQVQALLGLASVETAARYFRAGKDEQAAIVDHIFE